MRGPKREFTYLAVPYTSKDPELQQRRWVAVSRVAAHFMNEGLLVLSPVSHGYPIETYGDGVGGTWDVWKRLNKAMLWCSKEMYVLTLDGWRESEGVQGEIEIARTMNIPIFLVDPKTYEVCMFDDGNEVKVVAFRYEEMAYFFHAQWSDWMEWMFDKMEEDADGSMRIPASWVERWKRQMKTRYTDLPDKEQNSDREQVDTFMKMFGAD